MEPRKSFQDRFNNRFVSIFLTGYIDPKDKLAKTGSFEIKLPFEKFPFCCSNQNSSVEKAMEHDFRKSVKNIQRPSNHQ